MVFPDLCDFGRLREWHAEKESSFLSLSPAWSASTFKFEKTENQIEDGRLWKPVFSPVRKRWGPLLLCGWSGWSVGEISYLLSTATHWPTATLVWVDSIDSIYNCPHFFQTYDGPVQLRKAGGIPNSHAWTREAVNIAVAHVNSNSNRASVFVWVAFLARWESIWAGVKWIILSDIDWYCQSFALVWHWKPCTVPGLVLINYIIWWWVMFVMKSECLCLHVSEDQTQQRASRVIQIYALLFSVAVASGC